MPGLTESSHKLAGAVSRGIIDGFTLKMIAIAAMAVDHVGYSFFPGMTWLRFIGRLTMPIMSFLIAEGYFHTRNVYKYMLRLAAFALLSMPGFYFMTGQPFNVMITLLLGLGALYIFDGMKGKIVLPLRVLAVVCLMTFSSYIKSDWAPTGVLMVLAFGLARGDARKIVVYFLLILVFYFGSYAFWPVVEGRMAVAVSVIRGRWYALGMLMTLPLICLYNGKRGLDVRYFFYAFYPVHLLVISGIKYLIK